MSLDEKKKALLPMGKHELEYRRLFEANPDIYFYDRSGELYRNWDEFRASYLKNSRDELQISMDAPSLFTYVLQETDFFPIRGRDVDINYNARYCPPFWHHLNFIKIMYVLNGEFLIILSKEQTICLKAGNFIIVPPDIKHSVFSYHDEDIVVNIFLKLTTFEKAFASMLMEADGLSDYFWRILYGKDENSMILFHSPPDEFLEKLILDMTDEKNNPRSGGNFLMISYVNAFVAYALSRQQEYMTPVNDAQTRTDKFPEIIQYIRENYNTISLSELAAHFNRSEGYLSRYIKRETGYSLVQLLKEYRIKQAGIMLRSTKFSVEDIMMEVGYTDISYFYKVFKEFYGMTPKQYRELEKVIRLR